MKTTPEALLERIYTYTKQQGTLVNTKFRTEYDLTLENGITIKAVMEDAGYCHSIFVKGLLNCWLEYTHEVKYSFGDKNGLLTVARMIGFQVDF